MRRLDTAGVFERIFEIYRQQATLLLPAALLIFLPVACVAVLAAVTGSIALFVVGVVAAVVAQFWFQGIVVEAVRDMLDGRRDFTLEDLLRSVTPVLGALIWAGVMAAIGIGVGFLLFIVPGMILLTLWSLLAPVIVVERVPATRAFGRSREIVRGNAWRVFGVIVVLFLFQSVVGTLFQGLGEGLGGDVGNGIGQLIANVLLAPLSALAASIIYFQLAGQPVPAGGWQPPAPPS